MIDVLAWWDSLGRPLTRLPRLGAAALLVLLAAGMAWAAVAVAPVDRAETERVENVEADATPADSKGDLALYRRIAERMSEGEGYYPAAVEEQRASNYPTRPFVTVRPPTLGWLQQLVGISGVRIVLALLLLGCLWGLHRRLEGITGPRERVAALVVLALGGAAVAAPQSAYFHDVLAGLLLSLAFLFYSPGRWWPSLLAAALALAVRELAVAFVLLWLAFAMAEQRWREFSALLALLAVFAAGMYLHYLGVAAQQLPGDRASQGWDGMLGPALPLMAVGRLTALLFLPMSIAAPLAILPLLGWLGLGKRTGLFAALWFIGWFTAVAIFARQANFYWVQLVLPAYFAGLALAPRALGDLFRSAIGRT